MEEMVQATEAVETSASESTPEQSTQETSAPETIQGKIAALAPKTVATEAAPAAPKYTPNYAFKYASKDSKEAVEGKFDDFLHGVIKSPEQEKKMRELYEKAYGLDFVKPHYMETRESFKTLRAEHETLTGELQQLGSAIKNKDLDKAFSALGISEDLLFEHVAAKLQYKQLPPEEQAKIERQKQLEEEKYRADSEVGTLREQYNNTALQLRSMQLDMGLGNPEVMQTVNAIDSRLGKGAFKQRVIQYGATVYSTTGRDIPVEEAVSAVAKEYEPFITGQSQQAPIQQKKVPVIPNLAGRNTTPTSKVVSSIDDIKKRYKELTLENE